MPAVTLTTAQKIDILRRTISAYSITPEQVGEILQDLLDKSDEDSKNIWSNIQGISQFLAAHIEDSERQLQNHDTMIKQLSAALSSQSDKISSLSSSVSDLDSKSEDMAKRVLSLENRPAGSSDGGAVRSFAAVLRTVGMTYEKLTSPNKFFFCERDGKFVVLDDWGTDRNSDDYSLKFLMGVPIPGSSGAGAPMIWGVNFHSADLSWDESGLYASGGRLYRLRDGALVEFCAADSCSGGGSSAPGASMSEAEARELVQSIFGDFRLSGSVGGGTAGPAMTEQEGRDLAHSIFSDSPGDHADAKILTKDEAVALVRNIFIS